MSRLERRRCAPANFPARSRRPSDAEAWLGQANSAPSDLRADAEFAINLCVEELFLNAVKHGRANETTISISDRTRRRATRVRRRRPRLRSDRRAGEAPRRALGTDFEIGGFGTGLVQKFSRRMTYRRDDGHNRLVLEFDARTHKNPTEAVQRRMNETSALRADHPGHQRVPRHLRRQRLVSDRSRRTEDLRTGRRS